jgi:hypothetical protein
VAKLADCGIGDWPTMVSLVSMALSRYKREVHTFSRLTASVVVSASWSQGVLPDSLEASMVRLSRGGVTKVEYALFLLSSQLCRLVSRETGKGQSDPHSAQGI